MSPDYQRRTYTAYIHAAAEPAMKAQARTYSSLDTFPTTLAALGVEIEGNRLGLGANLFSGEPTLTEVYGKDFLAKEIPRRNTFLQKLESTESQTDALLERIQEKMQKAISITSYDSDTGQIDLEVSAAPDLYLAITDVEAACREKGSEKESRILLDKKKGENRVYTGTLDISGWNGPEGEIRISMKLIDGTEYRDIVTKELQELLE